VLSRLHGDTLRLAVGLFCLLLGALMLAAPHQFGDRTYNIINVTIPALGKILVVGGMVLGAVMVLGFSRRTYVAAHAVAAVPRLVLGAGQP